MSKPKRYLLMSIKNKKYNKYENPITGLDNIMEHYDIELMYKVTTNKYYTIYIDITNMKSEILLKFIHLVGIFSDVASYKIEDNKGNEFGCGGYMFFKQND